MANILNGLQFQDPVLQTNINFPLRNVSEYRKQYHQYSRCATQMERKDISKQYGIKPIEKLGTYLENPFFRLFDLYGFDIIHA